MRIDEAMGGGTTMAPLNLPTYEAVVRGGEIYDRLRAKFVALTPEEWVRQNFVAFLTGTLHYPAGLRGNEVSLTLNRTRRRCDTVVFDRSGRPWMIVEYKAPSVALTQAVFEQIARYNMVLNARYLVVSNGLRHFCVEYSAGRYSYLPQLPPYPVQ